MNSRCPDWDNGRSTKRIQGLPNTDDADERASGRKSQISIAEPIRRTLPGKRKTDVRTRIGTIPEGCHFYLLAWTAPIRHTPLNVPNFMTQWPLPFCFSKTFS
mgnify:CR=1 FL=1